jgi:PII-like signaling protein
MSPPIVGPRLVPARRLTIHLTLADHFHEHGHTRHTPLGTELLLRAHRAGMSGATTVHGVAGFGHSHKIHRQPVWGLVDRAPIIVMIVDTAERIDAFIAANQELFRECLATVSDLRMVPRPGGIHHPRRWRRA